ncbi:MAG: hypothetical protein IJ551_09745 [Prevotella sp.]|nr:hypothetical protein [Prevotella sp.]
MSHRKYSIPFRPSCWNCTRLRKSRRKIDGDPNDRKGAVSISAPSIIDAIAGYYCDNYWFGDKPGDEMLCGGREYKSVYHK